MEFKISETNKLLSQKASEALKQIKNQKYISVLQQANVKKALLIGIAFYGKEVDIKHEEVDTYSV